MGRPALPLDERRDKTIGVAVTAEERDRYHAEAQARGMRLAEMIRRAVEAFLAR